MPQRDGEFGGAPRKVRNRHQPFEITGRFFNGVERGYIDDVIMPHSTRKRIARALAVLRGKKVEVPVRKHDNLPV